MNVREAREILLLYRPETDDGMDPQVAKALDMASQDPELAGWLKEHCEFQRTMRSKFRQIQAPAPRRIQLIVQPTQRTFGLMWRAPAWIAAAALVIVLAVFGALRLAPRAPDRFADFQERMVSTALREYRMDLLTGDMRAMRQYLAGQGAPADYDLTPGLERLQLTGGGRLAWRSRPVSMVCFNRGDNQMLFLFIVNRANLKDPPAETPQVSQSHDLVTASWSRGDKTYVLAGPQEPGFVQKYL